MKQLAFPDSFLTGHSAIDDDHRHLITMVNRISACFDQQRGEEAHDICGKLQIFMADHNQREEKILRDAGFPRLDTHLKSHQKLMESCRQITTVCNHVCLVNRLEDCTTKLSTSIVEHIVGSDLDYKSFLQVEGLTNDAD